MSDKVKIKTPKFLVHEVCFDGQENLMEHREQNLVVTFCLLAP